MRSRFSTARRCAPLVAVLCAWGLAVSAVPAAATLSRMDGVPPRPLATTLLAAGDAVPERETAPARAPDPGHDAVAGIPRNVLDGYRSAQRRLALERPGCRLAWYHLAGIGRVESGHARGGRADRLGNTVPPILGPVLDGRGFAAIADTDDGELDGDPRWDRAVGPMQFVPGTWLRYAADGNGDGTTSPHNIFDAALGAGRYLCSGGLDLRDPAGLRAAVFRYNHSASYVWMVRGWMDVYADGVPGVTALPPDPVAVPAMPPPAPEPVLATEPAAGPPVAPGAPDPDAEPAVEPAAESAAESAVEHCAVPVAEVLEKPAGTEPDAEPAEPAEEAVPCGEPTGIAAAVAACREMLATVEAGTAAAMEQIRAACRFH
jgi:hypothetical protein